MPSPRRRAERYSLAWPARVKSLAKFFHLTGQAKPRVDEDCSLPCFSCSGVVAFGFGNVSKTAKSARFAELVANLGADGPGYGEVGPRVWIAPCKLLQLPKAADRRDGPRSGRPAGRRQLRNW
jgi:hypothetical protein